MYNILKQKEKSMSHPNKLLTLTLATLVLTSACGGEEDAEGNIPSGSTPGELNGSWYSGQGGTSVPYDPNTGTYGRPNGKGLIYIFEKGGRYRKAFQSYATNGGCTNGFTAHEKGTLVARGSTLQLHPTSGHMLVEDTCAPSMSSDRPLTGLEDELFTWTIVPSEFDPSQTVLVLRRSDGARGTFRRL
jgi:hypothetical protein